MIASDCQQGINMLTYGCQLTVVVRKDKRTKNYFFLIDEGTLCHCQVLSDRKYIYNEERIKLTDCYDLEEHDYDQVRQRTGKTTFINGFRLNYKGKIVGFEFSSLEEKAVIFSALNHLIQEAKNDLYLHQLDFKRVASTIGRKRHGLISLQQGLEQVKSQLEQVTTLEGDRAQEFFKDFIECFDKYGHSFKRIEQYGPNDYSKRKLNIDELLCFCMNEQKQMALPHHLEEINHQNPEKIEVGLFCKPIRQLLQSPKVFGRKSKVVTFSAFVSLILNKHNSIFCPNKLKLHQDMDGPLTDYYIYSSHNTYLSAHQLVGQSSTQEYINALRRGCRCVEIDCWDGSDGDPIVYHGHTLTSKLKFLDVIETISQYAFNWTEYPLIISLEIHCSLFQQRKMSEIMERFMGDMIYRVPFDSRNMSCFPSPNALKHKILLKSQGRLIKLFSQFESLALSRQERATQQRAYNRGEFIQWRQSVMRVWGEMVTGKDILTGCDIDTTNLQIMNLVDNYRTQGQRSQSADKNSLEKQKDIEDFLSNNQSSYKTEWHIERILCLFSTTVSFSQPLANQDVTIWNIMSLDENKVRSICQTEGNQFIDFNRNHFTRIYPAGSRVDSTNYDPVLGMAYGCQMSALNFQTPDLPMLLMQSYFQQNGGHGLVRKPDHLTPKKMLYPSDFLTVRRKIKLSIIWGISLIYLSEGLQIADPTVDVFIKGTTPDELHNQVYKVKVSFKHQHVHKFNNNEILFNIRAPDNTFVVFQITDAGQKGTQKLGQFAIPVTCIRPGLRIVPLLNSQLDLIRQSQLLVKTTITSY